MSRKMLFLGLVFAMCGQMIAQTPSAPAPTNEARLGAAPAPEKPKVNSKAPGAVTPDAVEQMLQEAMRQRDAIIRNLLQRVQELETQVNGGKETSRGSMGTVGEETVGPPAKAGSTTATASAASNAATDNGSASTSAALSAAIMNVKNSGYDATEMHASEALDQALMLQGGLLLPSGTMEVDNTVSYFSASSDHVAINGFALLPVLVVGDITSERVRNDILLPTFTTRLGLPKKWQADFEIPYGYQLQRTVAADNTQSSASNFGLGDMQVGLSRQLTFEHGKVPDLLANVRFKTRTGVDPFQVGTSSQIALGTGFYGIQGNLTAVTTNDPLVFFGNLSYTENLPADHTISANDPNNPMATMVGHFRPGAETGFQVGSVLAINPQTSMTMGWDQRFTRVTQLNGMDIPASYLVEGTLRLGTSYLIAPGRTVDLGFGVGLTPDTPNLQFSVGFPFRVGLWNQQHKARGTL